MRLEADSRGQVYHVDDKGTRRRVTLVPDPDDPNILRFTVKGRTYFLDKRVYLKQGVPSR